MSAPVTILTLMVSELVSPKSRGRFSKDRSKWEEIHLARFNDWTEGASIDQIAATWRVSVRSVHLSLAHVMARLHRKDRLLALALRRQNRDHWKVLSAALDEYGALLRSLPVNTIQRRSDYSGLHRFEEALERARQQRELENGASS